MAGVSFPELQEPVITSSLGNVVFGLLVVANQPNRRVTDASFLIDLRLPSCCDNVSASLVA